MRARRRLFALRLEAHVRADLQLARSGYGAADHAVVAVALDGAIGVQRGAAKVAFGVENDGVLVRLNASPTNCSLNFPSLKLKVRETLSSTLKKPGPRRRFLPVVPRVPRGVGECRAVEIRGVGIVAAQNLHDGIDLDWPSAPARRHSPRCWSRW